MTSSAKRKKERKKDFQVREHVVITMEQLLMVYRNRN
jgi:hypothetical protein